jgi:hypothetical protein
LTPEFWVTLASIFLAALGIVAAGIWQLTRSEGKLHQAINDMAQAAAVQREQLRRELVSLVDSDRRAFAESVAAIRQKVNDVELQAFKTFVRRDSFHEIMNRVSAENAAFKETLKERLDRQEQKLDRLIEQRPAA